MKDGDIREYLVPIRGRGDRVQIRPSQSDMARARNVEGESASGLQDPVPTPKPHSRTGPDSSIHRRSRVQLNEPHLPSEKTISMPAGSKEQSDPQDPVDDVVASHPGSTVLTNVEYEHKRPRATPNFLPPGPRNVVFESGSPMIRHIYHELEGLSRSELTAISDVVGAGLASLPEDKKSHYNEQDSSYAAPTLDSIDNLLREMRSDTKEYRSEVNEFASNVVELTSELNHFKSTFDNMLTNLKQQLHTLKVELDSLQASQVQYTRLNH